MATDSDDDGFGARTTTSNDEGFPANLAAVLGIATTLVVGVFAALGVSGNLLARMVRNAPGKSTTVVIVAIVAIGLFAIGTIVRRLPNWCAVVLVIVLVIALCAAAYIAADSYRYRESPSIMLSLSQTPDEGLTLTVKATGSSLGVTHRMLLRVVAITRPLSVKEFSYEKQRMTELQVVTNIECRRPQMHPRDPKTARLLYWTETGPNASGEAATEQTMPVPDNARYVCAWTVLSERLGEARTGVSDDLALVHLADIGEPDRAARRSVT